MLHVIATSFRWPETQGIPFQVELSQVASSPRYDPALAHRKSILTPPRGFVPGPPKGPKSSGGSLGTPFSAGKTNGSIFNTHPRCVELLATWLGCALRSSSYRLLSRGFEWEFMSLPKGTQPPLTLSSSPRLASLSSCSSVNLVVFSNRLFIIARLLAGLGTGL